MGPGVIVPAAIPDERLASVLGRTSPLTKLAVAVAWLVGLATTTQPWPPVAIALIAVAAGIVLGRISPGTFLRAIAPLWIVALVVTVSNAVFGAANPDPAATELLRLGPLRITEEAAATAVALGLRVVAIASVGAVFALTTDSTRLVDSLVQQAHVSERFAYGTLAAYQAVPQFADDLSTMRQARRIRGLRGSWHPRLLFGLLVLAIRHGDRMALAMDARAFGSGPRSRYRLVRWSGLDLVVAIGSAVALAGALWLPSAT
jgi:energy-coupling factor transport system permease protein